MQGIKKYLHHDAYSGFYEEKELKNLINLASNMGNEAEGLIIPITCDILRYSIVMHKMQQNKQKMKEMQEEENHP